jgi:hypothetical protein
MEKRRKNMKIQTRQNTFETNSSSTHSVTISTKSSKNQKYEPLVENGVLYPSRLDQRGQSFGDSSFLICGTPEEKTAIVTHWILAIYENGEISEETKDKCLNYLGDKTGVRIDVSDIRYPNYYPRGEYDDPQLQLDDEMDEDECFHEMDKIIKVINDDTLEITDSNTPY